MTSRWRLLRELQVPFALPLGLFLASALIGAGLGYAPWLAWREFALIAGGIGLGIALANLPAEIQFRGRNVRLFSLTLGILPALIVVYFLLTNDWASQMGKLRWLDPVLGWLAARQFNLPGYRLHPNAMGGAVAMLLPLQLAGLSETFGGASRRRWIGLALLMLSILGILLSELRGAWLALGAIAGIAVLWWLSGKVARPWTDRRAQVQMALCATIVVIVVAVGLAAFLFTPLGEMLQTRRLDRWAVWRNSLDLMSDYPFTGLGLAGFEMAYSSYVLLVHVGHTTHAHNLFLDIWLQQGLLGLLSFGGLVFAAVIPSVTVLAREDWLAHWQMAALASLGVLLMHGLVDDAFYGYGGKAIPLLFVPFGVLGRAWGFKPAFRMVSLNRFVFGGAVALAVLVFALPGVRAAWRANLGALLQTRAELSVYSWEQWQIQDALRRSDVVNLAPAIAQYQAARALDPTNGTANRRLGQIELSLGQYDAARQHLAAASASAPSQRATRQLLGESYALAGEIERAAALWWTIEVSENQLEIRRWWYEHLGEWDFAVRIRQAAQMRDADGFHTD